MPTAASASIQRFGRLILEITGSSILYILANFQDLEFGMQGSGCGKRVLSDLVCLTIFNAFQAQKNADRVVSIPDVGSIKYRDAKCRQIINGRVRRSLGNKKYGSRMSALRCGS
ncbi:MAG: hypothetical protein WBF52_21335 [Geitlerinemataceae cyanobacterium]